jgi:predicted nuclease of predicted toxin-antitoxin system
MKLLVDMNLAPSWVAFLSTHGVDAIHWSSVGPPNAPDVQIIAHARDHGFVVFTHDLDFGVLLALTRSVAPASFKFAHKLFCRTISANSFFVRCTRLPNRLRKAHS